MLQVVTEAYNEISSNIKQLKKFFRRKTETKIGALQGETFGRKKAKGREEIWEICAIFVSDEV